MSYKTFKELLLDESRSISGNDYVSSLDTLIYQEITSYRTRIQQKLNQVKQT